MPFTAGSPELAKANKLGNILAHLFTSHGLSGAVGRTGAQMIERQAARYGFGITGLTTGGAFPPFGTIYPGLLANTPSSTVKAALQNPRGSTLPSGITVGDCQGQTVGIYLRKFVRNGADYKVVLYSGLTLGATLSPGHSGISASGFGGTLDTKDRINFGAAFTDNDFVVVGAIRGYTLAAGASKSIPLAFAYAGATKSPGTVFSIETIGINSFTGNVSGQANNTSAVYGTTFAFGPNSGAFGYTATIYFNAPAGGSGTWSVN